MTLYQIKPAFQALLRPLMFWLDKKASPPITSHWPRWRFLLSLVLCCLSSPNLNFSFFYPSFYLYAWRSMRWTACWRVNVTNNPAWALFSMKTGDILSDLALYLPFMLLSGRSNALLVLVMLFCALMTGIS